MLFVTASLLAGAGLAYLVRPAPELPYTVPPLHRSDDNRSPPSLQLPTTETGAQLTLASLLRRPFGVGEQAAIYGIVMAAELDTLRAMARELWTTDRSIGVDFALDVVFSRMTEIDQDAGITLIREAKPNAEQVFTAALAVLVSRGVTSANIHSILRSLSQLDERRFMTEALKRLANTDPEQAVALAAGLHDRALRVELLHDIAVAWFQRDPTTAQAATANIATPGDRVAFEAGLLTALTLTDPERVLLDLARNAVLTARELDASVAAIRQLAKTNPMRALEFADGLEGVTREIALRTTIQEWGSEDPYGAIALLDRLMPGRDRDVLLQAIGEELGRQDPDLALAWFDSLEGSPPPGLYGSLLRGIAHNQPQRAFELALLDSNEPFANVYLMSVTSTILQNGGVSFASLADRVLATDDRLGREVGMQSLINAAAGNNPEDVLSWMVGNMESVGHRTLYQAATLLARQDPDATIQYTQLLPTEYKEGWVRAVAAGFAENDPARAREWLQQFRGDAIYDAGMTAIVQASAMRDPAGAAALLPSFADAAARDRAATTVAQHWAGRTPGAAGAWAATLPVGPFRDAALAGTMMSSRELPNAETLALFQSDQARERAVLGVALRRAREDHNYARGLGDAWAMVDRHIEDPDLRRQAEQIFESIASPPLQPPF
jgi:hypothetical protein